MNIIYLTKKLNLFSIYLKKKYEVTLFDYIK